MEKKRVAVPILCHGHSRPVVDLFYSPVTPDGFFLVSASKDSYPMLRNGETGDWIGKFEGHKGAVWSVCLDTNALRAASGSADFSAYVIPSLIPFFRIMSSYEEICLFNRKVWDALTGDVLHSFEHKHIVRACAFSEEPCGIWDILKLVRDNKKDTHLLLTGGVEKVLRVYDLNRPDALPREVDKSPSSVRTVSWMHSDQTILSSCTDMGGVRLWDVRSGEIVKTLETESSVTSAEVSQDGRYITTADGSTVKIWDANHFGLVRRYNMPCTVESASLEPIYGNKFIAGGEDMWVRVFDFQSGDEIGMFLYINLCIALYFLVITGFTSGPQHVTRVIMVRYTVCDSHRKGNHMPQDPRMEPLEYGTGPLTHNDTEPFAANGSG
ncbi:Serine-threonine kinase receptor-associated [Gossypium australe]|uniref:Serine-threonine kinase receptor-associated protein n=1 Tax=Gossypium australe TaxID=47621 RepID=A0A5B6VGL2_9ROSI|nr:Serine-threonine kinase receptor-associated [Gossypium australe]